MKTMTIAIAGGSGFAGKALALKLAEHGHNVRILARSVANGKITERLETRQCDIFSLKQTEDALQGVDIGVYLIHSMAPNNRLTQGNFQDLDLLVADNFARAARLQKLKRIVYLGGIVPEGNLSAHLKSRLEVEHALASYGTPTVTLRAALVIGAGGSSYKILARLVKRLPVMVCPAWTKSRSQPVSLDDAIDALIACCEKPITSLPVQAGGYMNLGCEPPVSYNQLMQAAARVYGRNLRIVSVPLNSYGLSKLWVRLFSGAERSLVEPLVESLKHDMLAMPNATAELIGRPAQNLATMLTQAARTAPVKLQLPRAQNLTERSVRSVQRLTVPPGVDAHWLAERYGVWLEHYFRGVIKVIRKKRHLQFSSQGIVLLTLEYSAERSDKTRALYYISGGSLRRREAGESGRLEFRTLPNSNEALAAIHDFEPALPWFIYANSQAPLHEFVMHRFRDYLSRYRQAARVAS